MHTPAHLILGAALFSRSNKKGTFWAALLGGLLPDLSLYVLAGSALFIFQISPNIVFGELYFSRPWQQVFAIDNSVFLWGALLITATWKRNQWWMAFTASALLHLACDFPLHHDDGRAHFWPLTHWVYQSPVSYWDLNHFAHFVIPLEILACAFGVFYLWQRYKNWTYRTIICVLSIIQILPLIFLITHMR